MSSPRILIYDIETAPLLGAVWRLWKTNVPVNQIKDDWYIMSYSAKWLGDSQILYNDLRELDPAEYETGDFGLSYELHALLSEADIVVAHNGRKFDNRRVNARFIKHGLPPPHNYKTVDTLIESRKQFDFPSHSLEYLTEHLLPEEHHKKRSAKFPGFELWAECMKGNREAWAEMEEYNRQDVVALEALYLKLRPWIIGHPNVGNLGEELPDRPACPKCGSTNVQKRGTYQTQVQRYQRYSCMDCGGWSRGRYTVADKSKRTNLLVN